MTNPEQQDLQQQSLSNDADDLTDEELKDVAGGAVGPTYDQILSGRGTGLPPGAVT